MKRSIKLLVLAFICPVLIFFLVTARQRDKTFAQAGAPALASLSAASPTPVPTISPGLPYAVPLAEIPSAPELAQPNFDDFSWQSFIALNWPVAIGPDGNPVRGQADTSKSIGDLSVPRVWESWKADYELFQPGGAPPFPWASYQTVNPPCGISTTNGVAQLRLKVLPLIAKGGSVLPDSVNQAMAGPLIDQHSNYARYEIRLNQTYYEYVSSNKLYLQANLPKYPNPRIQFPSTTQTQPPPNAQGAYGVVEVKAAWREMTPQDMNNPEVVQRYYIVQATVVDPGTNKCRQAPMGLVGLHIAHKVAPFTEWVWSTFEQEDNVPETTPPPAPPPGGYSFNNGTTKPPTQNGYDPNVSWKPIDPTNPPAPSPIQVTRANPILQTTQSLNQIVQGMLANTVWQHYKLIYTQWPSRPEAQFIVNNPATSEDHYAPPPHHIDASGGCGLPFPLDNVANVTMETFYQVTPPLKLFGTSCMHCHYQAAQTDFSWVLADMAYPRNPAASTPSRSQRLMVRVPTAPPRRGSGQLKRRSSRKHYQ